MFLRNLVSNSLRNVRVDVICKRNKVTLPNLPYDFKDLEPIISRDIMQIHHSKHHAAYVNNYNAAEEKLQQAVAQGDTKSIIELGPALKFNGGGHLNHSIFWEVLTPSSTAGKPSSDLHTAINNNFGSFDAFKTQLSTIAVGIQGSGWAWLGYNPKSKGLALASCANQDPLQATTGLVPLFGIDVWEHAYYLQYKNARPDYVKAIFEIVNWDAVSKRYAEAIKA
ncbi:hypothetical protein V9T40_004159 [Parthenolecanium corni]|uniref:Superoxide dismutase n=1 Tax=Parthenolecanium corni TaxID=536013 RepID=A0AAN9TVW6_9HEMI